MNFVVALFVLSISVFGVLSAPYKTPPDLDVNQIIKNDRLFNSYVDCYLDKKPCTPEGQTNKDRLPEILRDHCQKCDEKNRKDLKTVIIHIRDNKPVLWKAFNAKYNPDGIYNKSIEELTIN